MKADLKRDLQYLQTEHAIDDSLIESLLASKSQAKAHLQFWTQMMWGLNGGIIAMMALVTGFFSRQSLRSGPVWMLGFAGLTLCGLLWAVRVLQRQRAAKHAVVTMARKHNLI